MTDYSELLNDGRIKSGSFSEKQVRDRLDIARRDLKTSEATLDTSPDWAFNIAYNAMHQTGRAFMFRCGYRAVGKGHHITVIRFLKLSFGTDMEEPLAVMDRMRRKRNEATYDTAGTISEKAASEALETAREFVAEIERRLKAGS